MGSKDGDGMNPLETKSLPTYLLAEPLGSRTRYGWAKAEGARARQGLIRASQTLIRANERG